MIGLLLSLAISASAAEAPFYLREAKSARDVGSLNENFRATSDAIRRSDLTNGGTIDGTVTTDEICFADGTCQTTAPVAPDSVEISSQAARLSNVGWGSVPIICRSTLTVSGSTFTVHANINSTLPSAGTVVTGYLVDGQCPSSMVCSKTAANVRTPWLGSSVGNNSFSINIREILAPGEHSFCIWSSNDAGATTTGNFLDFWVEYK